jgi:hypothetical protein
MKKTHHSRACYSGFADPAFAVLVESTITSTGFCMNADAAGNQFIDRTCYKEQNSSNRNDSSSAFECCHH